MAEGHPKIIEFETVSGVITHVTPLSIYTIQALKVRAADEFPYPDKAAYEVASELTASGVIPAEENPAYKEACAEIDLKRSQWRIRQTIELACQYPGFSSKEALLAHFRPTLETIRKFITFSHDDDWQNVLEHCIFTGRDDFSTVFSLAGQDERIPLTGGEVIDGIRLYFLDVSKQAIRKLA